jgi:hypothetical protein
MSSHLKLSLALKFTKTICEHKSKSAKYQHISREDHDFFDLIRKKTYQE